MTRWGLGRLVEAESRWRDARSAQDVSLAATVRFRRQPADRCARAPLGVSLWFGQMKGECAQSLTRSCRRRTRLPNPRAGQRNRGWSQFRIARGLVRSASAAAFLRAHPEKPAATDSRTLRTRPRAMSRPRQSGLANVKDFDNPSHRALAPHGPSTFACPSDAVMRNSASYNTEVGGLQPRASFASCKLSKREKTSPATCRDQSNNETATSGGSGRHYRSAVQ